MFKKDWVKELKKLSFSKGADTFKMEITPYRDWRVLAGVFFVGLVVSLGFNIYMSVEINSDSFFTTVPKNGDGVELNKDGLANVLADFADKKAIFEKVKTEGVSVVDPSL
ncbi:MAG: hypothetical protein HZB11_02515 [Candidatus Yonathbacteria bacterium]|nr:hypothetical protein [Candidatus Yonathbacteria bacterium]